MMRKLTVLLLSGTICLLGAIPLLAKSQYATIEEYEKVTGNKIEEFSEAPGLRIKVAAGELPPVEERLPEEPVVVEPVEEIGQYGGTWTQSMTSSYHIGLVIGTYAYELPVIWSRGMTEIIPNVFKSWEISEDGKAFTFHLRKGMKWSDGHPFTTEDIRFWWEDIMLNIELSAAPTDPMELQVIDDYTVTFRFSEPNGLYLEEVAHDMKFWRPAHYLKQFHPAYTPMEELDKRVKEEGYGSWVDMFLPKIGGRSWGFSLDPECPTLNPWILKTTEFPAIRFVFERNPYYWKVDSAGNQLPYLDRAIVNIVADTSMVNMQAMTGASNLQDFFTDIADYPLYVENQEKGNYRVFLWPTDWASEIVLLLDQHVKDDEVQQEIVRDVRFRRALSLAIDREEINQICYLGLGVPRQATVVSTSPLYKEEYAEAYAQYDPERANALLDEMGLTERDKDGFRLRPDGKTLSLIIGYYLRQTLSGVDALGMIKDNWESIGIKVMLRTAAIDLIQRRLCDGEISILVHDGFDAYYPIYPRIAWFIPMIYYRTPPRFYSGPSWNTAYNKWYTTKEEETIEGEEPSPEAMRLYDIWDEITVTMDPKKRNELFQEILKFTAENVNIIGVVGEVPHVVVVANNFRNVPEKHPWTTLGRYLGPVGIEQFFIKQK